MNWKTKVIDLTLSVRAANTICNVLCTVSREFNEITVRELVVAFAKGVFEPGHTRNCGPKTCGELAGIVSAFLFPKVEETCEWVKGKEDDKWKTDCGREITVFSGPPLNNYSFCLHCGKKIVERREDHANKN